MVALQVNDLGVKCAEPLMRATQVAEQIGVHVTTFRRWCQKGEGPPYIKIGRGHFLFRPEDVQEWLKQFQASGKVHAK